MSALLSFHLLSLTYETSSPQFSLDGRRVVRVKISVRVLLLQMTLHHIIMDRVMSTVSHLLSHHGIVGYVIRIPKVQIKYLGFDKKGCTIIHKISLGLKIVFLVQILSLRKILTSSLE